MEDWRGVAVEAIALRWGAQQKSKENWKKELLYIGSGVGKCSMVLPDEALGGRGRKECEEEVEDSASLGRRWFAQQGMGRCDEAVGVEKRMRMGRRGRSFATAALIREAGDGSLR